MGKRKTVSARISQNAYDLVLKNGKMGETFADVLDRLLKVNTT